MFENLTLCVTLWRAPVLQPVTLSAAVRNTEEDRVSLEETSAKVNYLSVRALGPHWAFKEKKGPLLVTDVNQHLGQSFCDLRSEWRLKGTLWGKSQEVLLSPPRTREIPEWGYLVHFVAWETCLQTFQSLLSRWEERNTCGLPFWESCIFHIPQPDV